MRIVMFLALCGFIDVSAQNISRYKNETSETFIQRIKPAASEIHHKVLEIKWNGQSAIVAFFTEKYVLPKTEDPSQMEYKRVIAKIYMADLQKTSYWPSIIDTIPEEGGPPIIASVFFANADTDKDRELVILTTWNINNASVSGTLYSTTIFDFEAKLPAKLLYMRGISTKVEGGCDCIWVVGRIHKSLFKNAEDIRKGLSALGLKQ